MEYTEYMETLKEQIQNKRERSLVAEAVSYTHLDVYKRQMCG